MYHDRYLNIIICIKGYATNGALELRPTLHHQLQSATAMRHSQIQILVSLISSDCVSLFAFVTGNFPAALIIKQREILVVRLCWPCTTATPLQRFRNMKLTQLISSYRSVPTFQTRFDIEVAGAGQRALTLPVTSQVSLPVFESVKNLFGQLVFYQFPLLQRVRLSASGCALKCIMYVHTKGTACYFL